MAKNSTGTFFEWVGKPNDPGPRTKGSPHAGGMPTIVEPTDSYSIPKLPAWPTQQGGATTDS